MTDVRDAELTDLLARPAMRGEVGVPGTSPPQPIGQRPPLARAPGHGALDMGERRAAALARWRPTLLLLLYFAPTILAGLYYGLIASDRYVSTAGFIIRSASKPAGDTGLGAILRMAGLGRAEDDTYSVQSFLLSRDAARGLQQTLPLREIYNRPGLDPLSRYPSLIYGSTNEDLFRYYTSMTQALYNTTTGLTTLTVQAFRPDDALAIATRLLALAENLVNDLNNRIRQDAVVSAEAEVKHQEERLTDAQVALTTFQNKESMIDPTANAVIVSELSAKLQADLAQTQARIADMAVGTPNSPSLAVLRRQAEVTQKQIQDEEARVTSQREGLADKLGRYQHLYLEREFASKALGLAESALDSARSEARRKQLYIERILEPSLADKSTLPLRLWTTFTVFILNAFVLFIGWMLTVGVKEHVSSTR